jgi:Tol biopolymer transport system component/DNA-binding winged helix-turn-helix (wHTH) protein
MSFLFNGLIRFEEYEIDRAHWRLSWQREPLPLNRKTFDLLLYLIDHSDRVVSKDELLQALWPGSFVEESNLTQHVFLLRKSLSRHESGKRIIETVPGRGYRFAATISEGTPAGHPEVIIRASESVTRITLEEEEEETDREISAPLPTRSQIPALDMGRRETPPRSKPTHRLTRVALPILVAVVAISVTAFSLLTRQPRLRVTETVRLTNDGVSKHLVGLANAVVNDGSHLIFTESRDNQSVIAEVPLEGGEVQSVPAPFDDAAVVDYSKVNHKLLIGSTWSTSDERPILAQDSWNAKPIQVGELTGHDASWSPDARSIAVAKGRFLYIADADGSNQRRVVSASGIIFVPKWSPDGRRIRFSENLGSTEDRLWEVDISGANLHRVLADTPDSDQVCCGNWSADGNFFYVVRGIITSNIWVLPGERVRSFFRKPLPTRLTVGQSDIWHSPLPSADGHTMWAIGSHLRGQLMTVNPVTRSLQPYLGGISAEGVSFSNDGRWIAYTAFPEGTIWRSRPDGSEKQQLTKPPLVARFPQWSPDGKTIAFMASQSGSIWKIYLIPSAGGAPQPMLDDNATQGVPNWSPDGKQISFGKLLDYGNVRDPNLTVEFYDLKRHSHKTLHGSEGMWTPRWSPDGRFLTAVTEDNRNLRLYDMQTQQWTNLANVGVNDVIWSRDSRYVYFDTLFGDDPSLYRISMDSRKLERWADLRGLPRGGFYGPWLGITPDGSPLLLRDTSIEEIYRLDLESSN